ncbi:6-carboxytetrahydropterin synthase QueD [Bacteroidia bacterium]|nr:6-carboxytetrahydropterin synthase QueD [Bacteroidia bacterium]GHV42848.1 6-carboxytetrahydropterin synthase QueD [Bacteroidia bacterium]
MIAVTKIFSFEMAHALNNYNGACSNIHGHSYKLEVSVAGEIINDKNSPKFGMIIDFKDLKSIVNEVIIKNFDHFLVLNKETDENLKNLLMKSYQNIKFVDFQPTNENLLLYFADLIRTELPKNTHLQRLKMYETETSFAELLC